MIFSVTMIQLDGSYGEGGGQIARTALALSAVTGKAFTVDQIRVGRKQPGLKAQHLMAVTALQDLCKAEVEGTELGSTKLVFRPGKYEARRIKLDIGTAGSIPLLLQSLLLPAMVGEKTTTFDIIGGTDTKWAMPMDYMKNVLFPQLKKYADINLMVHKRGYYPKGGGHITLFVKPKFSLKDADQAPAIDLTEQGELQHIKGGVHCAKSLADKEVGERIMRSAQSSLKTTGVPVSIDVTYYDTLSTGCGIVLWAVYTDKEGDINKENPVILGADALGEIHVPAEEIGKQAAVKLIKEIQSGGACDEHLADNLIPFLGIFQGKIQPSEMSNHCKTNIYTTEHFLGKVFTVDKKMITRARQV